MANPLLNPSLHFLIGIPFSTLYWLNFKKNLFWNRKIMKISIQLFKFFDPIVTGGARGDFENLPVTSNRKTWLLCSASMAVLYHLSFKYGTSLCGLATELLKFTYERPKQTFFNWNISGSVWSWYVLTVFRFSKPMKFNPRIAFNIHFKLKLEDE